ncbi:MAG: hypothetical protein D6815_03235 [Candidatus Dadabacteria bacterium]|nr:MAG: hypothetical protein D6815_03235 [Candidatus Dadabacteria bacterium]
MPLHERRSGTQADGASGGKPSGSGLATGRQPAAGYWTCPMPEHASVREQGPGRCPLCGMELVPVPAQEAKP